MIDKIINSKIQYLIFSLKTPLILKSLENAHFLPLHLLVFANYFTLKITKKYHNLNEYLIQIANILKLSHLDSFISEIINLH